MIESPGAIVCTSLCKRFQTKSGIVEAVKDLDLSIQPGECFGLLGPNGAGKTTTVEILEGLLAPTSGRVEVLGIQWGAGRDRELRQKIGMTLQETTFQEKLSVLEIIRLFRSFYGSGLPVEEALDLVSLREKASARVGELSGGQKQRLAVAVALVGDPELVFLDEPTTGLDPQARRSLWNIVSDLGSRGRTILLTTHYMEEAERLCDRVAIVDSGRIIAEGKPRDLISRLGGKQVLEFTLREEPQGDLSERLSRLDSVTRVTRESEAYQLSVSEPHVAIPQLLDLLRSKNLTLESLLTRHANLEDVFMNLTGRHLRDV